MRARRAVVAGLVLACAACGGYEDGGAVLTQLDEAGVVACDEILESSADLWVCRSGTDTVAAIVDQHEELEAFIQARQDAGHDGAWILGHGFVVELPPALAMLAPDVADELGGEVQGTGT